MSLSKEVVLKVVRDADDQIVIEAIMGETLVVRDLCDLRSVDDRRRCAGVIHDKVPALSQESIERELALIDPKEVPKLEASPDDPWRPELAIERPSLPAFPVHVLP